MNQNQKKSDGLYSLRSFLNLYSITRPLFPILAVLIAAGFFLAMKNDFDYVIGHFEVGSLGFGITVGCIIAGAVLSAILALISQKSASFADSPIESPLTIFSSLLAALMSLAVLISSATDMMLGVFVSRWQQISMILTPFIGISMILSLIPKLRTSKIRQICAIFAVVSINFAMFANHFNFDLPLNSPIRNLVIVSNCAILLYLLSEARFSFGKANGRLSIPFFLFSSGMASTTVLGYSVGAILSKVFSANASDPNPSVFVLALYAAIGLHAVGRMLSITSSLGEYTEPAKEDNKSTEKTE